MYFSAALQRVPSHAISPSFFLQFSLCNTTLVHSLCASSAVLVSSTVASHRSFASQVTSSNKTTSAHGGEGDISGIHSSDSIIPPHVGKPPETIEEEWAKKPFVMPDDEEIFRIRGLEKRRKQQKKLDNMLPVAEKTTFASRMAATVASDSLKEELLAINERIAKEMESIKAATVLPTEHYHREKENMAEFIAKKREIFLVQMSLDNKRAEIRKLEERAYQREEALRKSEQMLVEDTAQFEAFLKQNDEKVQEALKKAEQQTKLKQDKLADIKRLNANMATVKKDLNKFQEQLDECKKYKDFILSLTPKEWLEANSNPIAELGKNKNDANESSAIGSEGEETDTVPMEPMYFQSPNQLLEIFRDLEEKNLLLMQESQDIETSLEELKSKFNDIKIKNEAKITNLKSQLQSILMAIKTEEDRQTSLQKKTNVNTIDKKFDVSFDELAAKVSEVYVRCGLEDDPSIGTLQKLTSIEAKLEESILALQGIPADFIEQTEKSREKQRRLALREEKMEKQRIEQEKRAERSLERAHAPIPRKTGKPIMFRSHLFKKKKRQVTEVKTDEDKELIEFLERDY
ncbi:hypothetical protein KP509_09G031700 [Ceratopteris richardii]|uniref:DUF4200 domain-containing protein n=1 Tax=Ceratopteris richardii TaxID=49495 RepID=A0A8T2U072_CERRI|nr:hypothetical protein KP509_09G031700 [Ceratopteris richardii]